MSAAMAGMLPTDVKKVNLYPENALYSRVMNQHFVRRPFKVRFASPADITTLEQLEKLVWGSLGVPKETLLKRMEVCPVGCFVCTVKDKVVAALYTQRISDLAVLDEQKFQKLHETHEPDGNIIQLIAIATHPDVSEMRIGEDLRNFALHLARLDPSVDCVIGVTRCQEFKSQSQSMEEYMKQHMSGLKVDPIVDFHTGYANICFGCPNIFLEVQQSFWTSHFFYVQQILWTSTGYGAKVARTVPNFRPEDTDNSGCGVLIMYDVKDLPGMGQASGHAIQAVPQARVSVVETIKNVVKDIGYW